MSKSHQNKGKKVRSFIAIEVPEKIQKEVISLKENISSDYTKVRWVRKENIHLTLIFLGEIAEDVIAHVKERMQTVSKKHKTFNMALQGTGVFPNFKRPRVLWVGVSPESKEPIIHLAHDLMNSLDFLKIDERKDFTPHITFGRIKSVYDSVSLKSAIESMSIKTEEFTAKEITLFKSVLKPDGAVYTPLTKFPLQPSNKQVVESK